MSFFFAASICFSRNLIMPKANGTTYSIGPSFLGMISIIGRRAPRPHAGSYPAGRSLEILGVITSLEEVQLSACEFISDAGLVHIAKLPRLRQVSVDATASVTRAGIGVFSDHVQVHFWT